MTAYLPAPDGQPTENIELQLDHAIKKCQEWRVHWRDMELKAKAAEGQVNHWQDTINRLDHQLRLRKWQEGQK